MVPIQPLERTHVAAAGALYQRSLPVNPLILRSRPHADVGGLIGRKGLNARPRGGACAERAHQARLRLAYQLMEYCSSWALVSRLSLRLRLWRCDSTVFTLTPSAAAASREDRPRPMSVRTCSSRVLSRSMGSDAAPADTSSPLPPSSAAASVSLS